MVGGLLCTSPTCVVCGRNRTCWSCLRGEPEAASCSSRAHQHRRRGRTCDLQGRGYRWSTRDDDGLRRTTLPRRWGRTWWLFAIVGRSRAGWCLTRNQCLRLVIGFVRWSDGIRPFNNGNRLSLRVARGMCCSRVPLFGCGWRQGEQVKMNKNAGVEGRGWLVYVLHDILIDLTGEWR